MSQAASPGVITLLTDFGEGSYVASVKGVLLSLAPTATLVDITHTLPPGGIGPASHLLKQTARHFPPDTVHLAVVDPGVGTDRLALVVACRNQFFVGPDNGLFYEVIRGASDARVYALDAPPAGAHRDRVCPTFHGRDLFAPAAARLATGETPASLGREVDRATLVRSPIAPPRRSDRTFFGQVVWVDRFGNLITNLVAEEVREWAAERPYRARIGGTIVPRRIVTFADGKPGEAALLAGSWDTMEIVVPGGSAAEHLGVAGGEPVRLEFPDGS